MMVDTTIYGYAVDGAAVHPRCLPGTDVAHAQGEIAALYYLDDEDPHGLTCDGCGGYIFEPTAVHEFVAGDSGACRECSSRDYCGEDAACELHVQNDLVPDGGVDEDWPEDSEAGTLPMFGFSAEEANALIALRERFADRSDH